MKKIIKYSFLLTIVAVFVFPFVWMLLSIFKTNAEIWQEPYKLIPESFSIYKVLGSLGNIHFATYIKNSLFMGIVGTFLMILTATLFTYVTVFLKSKYTNILFIVVMGTYMLPGAVTYVPSYVILAKLHLLDNLWGLIFSNLANVFVVFYLRQSFMKMSYDYIEAARIDGANHLSILRHVIFPLNKSAFCTVFVLTFITQYNNYMWPSIMLKSKDNFLISQGLRQFFIQDGAYGMNWAEVMLASTVAIVPVVIIFIIGQKWFITGISQESGLK